MNTYTFTAAFASPSRKKILAALLRGPATTKELSQATGLSRQRLQAIRRDLVARGVVTKKKQYGSRWWLAEDIELSTRKREELLQWAGSN